MVGSVVDLLLKNIVGGVVEPLLIVFNSSGVVTEGKGEVGVY